MTIASRSPARVGEPAHVAIQVLAFMTNAYMTGATVFVDGGADA